MLLEKSSIGFTTVILAVALTDPAAAQEPTDTPLAVTPFAHVAEISFLDAVFQSMVINHWDQEADELEFFYGDTYRVIRQINCTHGKFRRLWKSIPLEGRIRELFVEDLDQDGSNELVAFTDQARIYIWRTSDYKLIWDSFDVDFASIQAMTIGNVDHDAALELVLCVDNRIVYYDGVGLLLEKVGRDTVAPVDIHIGNVDGDPEDEIVTSDGNVFDARTLTLEWSTEYFGDPMYLYDFDQDGVLEVVGEKLGGIKVWDVEERRELF